jgi:hypothetical protein
MAAWNIHVRGPLPFSRAFIKVDDLGLVGRWSIILDDLHILVVYHVIATSSPYDLAIVVEG